MLLTCGERINPEPHAKQKYLCRVAYCTGSVGNRSRALCIYQHLPININQRTYLIYALEDSRTVFTQALVLAAYDSPTHTTVSPICKPVVTTRFILQVVFFFIPAAELSRLGDAFTRPTLLLY